MKKYLVFIFASFVFLLLFSACTETEQVVEVSSVTISQPSAEIVIGETITLTVTVSPSNATEQEVTWASSQQSVATVNNRGLVTAIAIGETIITATASDKTAICKVTVKSNLPPSETIGAENISAISVILKGKANLPTSVSSDLIVGFQYSQSAGILPSNSTTVEVTEADANYNYSFGITCLAPATKYYYRSFVRQNGQDTYGETKSFTTKELGAMIRTAEASEVSTISARMNGIIDLTDVQYANKSIGFYYGTSPESMSSKVSVSEDGHSFYSKLSILPPSTDYFFQGFVVIDEKEYRAGETKSFKTKELSSLLKTEDATEIEATSAKLNAMLNLTDVQYETIEYGFYWGSLENSLTEKLDGSFAENAISSSLADLSHKTQYWYKAYVKLDSQTFYGEVKTFTTDVVPVESVSLDKMEYTFKTIGNTVTLKATVLPADATDKSVSWTSDKETVATVDANGKVIAKNNGTANITATTKDQGKVATCIITVAQWVTGITLDKTSLTLNEGQEQTLIPTVNPSNAVDKSLNWTSSDTSVATVDAGGKVTAVSKGTATIKATANDGSGKYAKSYVYVNRLVTSIELDKSSITIFNGKTATIKATVYPSTASNKGVTWTSSNTSVATVSTNGTVTGVSSGTAKIIATAEDGSGVSASCSVEVKQSVTIILNKESLSLNEGQTEALTATVSPDNADDKTITWSSSNESVATVDETGKVTAISKGIATIKAEAINGGGTTATCSVKVIRLVSSIMLDKPSIVIYNGKSETITASVSPSTASNKGVTWTSSNTSVATVSTNGEVTGVARGTAKIIATAEDGSGVSASCSVEVKQYVRTITLDKKSLSLLIGEDATLSVTSILPEDADDKTYSWSSSDSEIASVDNSGKVTAKAKGKATIKAKANDGSGVFSYCSVIVKAPCPPDAVDLGLSVYWGTCNIGASSPEGYGLFYAWGETETKTSFTFDNYKYKNKFGYTKYGYEKKVLDPEDDVAHVKLGDNWRIPTTDEWDELWENCTSTWTSNYNSTGVSGMIFKSKIKGFSDKTIFLPASGYPDWSQNREGHYMPSSLAPWDSSWSDYPIWEVYFREDWVNRRMKSRRACGFSVRPVYEP